MLSAAKSLPSSMVHLCNRLASEQVKVQTWELCRQLREEYAERLAGGESMGELEADIQVRVLQAAQDQFNRTMPAKKHPPLGKASQASRFPGR